MNKQPVVYYQTDPRWKSIPYALPGEASTIGGSGCGPTAMAMVLATWADPAVTPATECAWALKHGFKALRHGTYYGYFPAAAKRYGLSCVQMNGASLYGNSGSGFHAQAVQFLAGGDLIIACMGPGLWTRSGHFVLVYGVKDGVVYINDPASSRAERTRGDWGLFRQQVKFYFRVRRPASAPAPAKEDPDMTAEEVRKIAEETAKVAVSNLKKELMEQIEAVRTGLLFELTPPVYDSLNSVPDWAKEAVRKRVEEGVLEGSGQGLGLTVDLMRTWVVQDREEALRKTAESYGMD